MDGWKDQEESVDEATGFSEHAVEILFSTDYPETAGHSFCVDNNPTTTTTTTTGEPCGVQPDIITDDPYECGDERVRSCMLYFFRVKVEQGLT